MKKNVQRLMMLAVTVMASISSFAQTGETTTLKPLDVPISDFQMVRYHVVSATSPGEIEFIGFATNVNEDETQMTNDFDGTVTIYHYIDGSSSSPSAWVTNVPANAFTSTTLYDDTPNKSNFAACADLVTRLSIEYKETGNAAPATIGSNAFGGLTKLTEVINLTPGEEIQAIPTDAFATNVYKTATLIVPEGSMGNYADVAGWKNFLTITDGSIILGDYDGQNGFQQKDVTLLQRALKKTNPLNPYNAAVDMNGDGIVNQKDYTLLTRRYKALY